MDITIKPLTPERIEDYLYFFDNIIFSENPDWSKCYCYSYHFIGTNEQWNKKYNRIAVIQLIKEEKMKGFLAYSDGIPIGWCNVNNRLNYQRLLKYYDLIDKDAEKVCSIVCFLISPEFRRKGVAQKILEAIEKTYRAQNYECIEAYPGIGDLSSEKNYKGPLKLYMKNEFSIVKEEKDFFVVRKEL